VEISSAILDLRGQKLVQSFVRDITERKKQEAQLNLLYNQVLQQKLYAELIVRSIADGVYTVDTNRVIQSWNQGAEAITGFTAKEVLVRPCREFLSHCNEQHQSLCETGSCPIKMIWESAETAASVQAFAHHKDGHLIRVAITVASLKDQNGQTVGTVEVFRDVSREWEFLKSIQEANQAKANFLTGMSHELRTPLNGIIGFAEVLEEDYVGQLNEKQKEYLAEILGSAKHLLALIDEVLKVAHLETEKLELEPAPVKIRDLMEDALILIKVPAQKGEVSLKVEIPEDLVDLEIRVDENKMRQVLFNLLSNAVKFSRPDGEVFLGAKRAGDDLEVSVTDHGLGISAEEKEKIFEAFYQVQGGLIDKTPGVGLGLHYAKRLVELHGGNIRVESDGPGKGSTFIFRIPLGEGDKEKR
jgi:PAS domain S-box-containing protein